MAIRPAVSTIRRMYRPEDKCRNPYAAICLEHCPQPNKPCKKGTCEFFVSEYNRLKENEQNTSKGL
jgi:hypothetical protein